MRFKKRGDEEPRIGIAPLIDIVFLLLLFFMVTSHFDIASGVRINLPRVARKIAGDYEENRMTLVVDRSARIYLEGKRIDLKNLQKTLEDLVKQKRLLYLVLQADKDIGHGKVVQIMDLAKSAGVRSIIIAARWRAEKQP